MNIRFAIAALALVLAPIHAVKFRWVVAQDYGKPRTDHTVSSVGEKFYVIGGCSDNGNGCPSASMAHYVDVYDTATQTSVQGANMTVPRYRHSASVMGSKIYVIGGRRNQDDECLSHVEVYDTIADSWTTIAPIPEARSDHDSFVLNGRLYVFGGYTQNYDIRGNGWVYAPSTNSWQIVSVQMTQPRGDFAAVIYNGRAYVLGGFTNWDLADVGCSKSVEWFDGTAWSTEKTPPMNLCRGDAAAALIDFRLVVAGGESRYPEGSNNTVILQETESWAIGESVWREEAPMPTKRFRSASDPKDSKQLWVFGGQDTNVTAIAKVEYMEVVSSASVSAGGVISFVLALAVLASVW